MIRGGRRMGPLLGLALLAGALCGCGGASDIPDIPDVVETMMAAKFPADGQIHVQSQGKIAIKPETAFCTFPDSFGIDSDAMIKLFRMLKQPTTHPSGSGRWGLPVDKYSDCKLADAVLVAGSQLQNRQGKPYKLVLAVWQGDPGKGGAVWVGGVEREAGMLHPNPTVRVPIEPAEVPLSPDNLLNGSVESDSRDLSSAVTDHIELRELR